MAQLLVPVPTPEVTDGRCVPQTTKRRRPVHASLSAGVVELREKTCNNTSGLLKPSSTAKKESCAYCMLSMKYGVAPKANAFANLQRQSGCRMVSYLLFDMPIWPSGAVKKSRVLSWKRRSAISRHLTNS